MAGEKAKTTEKKVRIKIPRGANGDNEDITASLNGKVYQIKRGVEVEVPEGIAEILKNAEIAEEEAFKYIEEKQQ